MNGPRTITLTDAGLRAIGHEPLTWIRLVDLPWRDDRHDLREGPR